MENNLYLILYNEMSSPGTPYEVIKDKFAVVSAKTNADAINKLDVALFDCDDIPVGMTITYYNYRAFPIEPDEIVIGEKGTMKFLKDKGEELNVYTD